MKAVDKIRQYSPIILSILVFSYSFSQTKNTVYYNEAHNPVSEINFYKQKDSKKNLDIYFENDTLITGILVQRKNYGKLDAENFTILKKSISPENTLSKELIVIIYYPGKDRCNGVEQHSTWNILDGEYQRTLKKIGSFDHFWVYKNEENLKYYNPKIWQIDQGQIVENLFFKFHYPCFSFVIINQEGDYLSYFGEFGKNTVWELAQEIKDKSK